MPSFIDISGVRFSRWTAIRRESAVGAENPLWLCVCDCGIERLVSSKSMRSGHTKSCGCIRGVRQSRAVYQTRWRARHPDVNRKLGQRDNARRRARKWGAVGNVSQQQIDWRAAMFGNRCWQCGGPYECMDHVKPLSKGGLHWPANLRPSCLSCNHRKKAKWPYKVAM